MPKPKTIFVCQSCGRPELKWIGRCPDCQSWNSFVEEIEENPKGPEKEGRQGGWEVAAGDSGDPIPISEVDATQEPRLSTGISEFDRVTGGGLVPGSVLLVGGDPGVGKSTLMLQVLARLAESGRDVLYITGEESTRQVKLRAERLEINASKLLVAAQTDLTRILETIRKVKPAVCVVDSIQTAYSPDLASAPGSVGQVRESAAQILGLSKRRSIATLLVGHVTKEGTLAGPRVLEHMVDCVLQFEGERGYPFRVLRAAKNRFGSTNEVGVFEMGQEGLIEVRNPSELFLAERSLNEPGSVVTASVEGTRPLLVEIQALVSPTNFGTPRRTCNGVDPNRVALLAAVLEKKGGLDLIGCDIFVNVAGGVRLTEPAADLAVIAALASSFVDKPIPSSTVVFGEVGLAGEVRSVGQPEWRLAESAKMGFTRAVLPPQGRFKQPAPEGVILHPINHVSKALEVLF